MTDQPTESDRAITDYWFKHYADEHCTICGNSGVIDSRGIKTAAGFEVGKLNYCICPNGQALRRGNVDPLMYLRGDRHDHQRSQSAR